MGESSRKDLSMTKEEKLKFQIAQLRQDKIIFATESVAATLVSMLVVAVILFIGFPIPNPLVLTLLLVFIVGAVGYWVYVSVGNMKRFNKIQQLEKELYS